MLISIQISLACNGVRSRWKILSKKSLMANKFEWKHLIYMFTAVRGFIAGKGWDKDNKSKYGCALCVFQESDLSSSHWQLFEPLQIKQQCGSIKYPCRMIPEASAFLQPIWFSAHSPIKLWLQSKVPPLYQTSSLMAQCASETASWWLIDVYSKILVLFCLFLSQQKHLKWEDLDAQKLRLYLSFKFYMFCVCSDTRFPSACLCEFLRIGCHSFQLLFNILHTSNHDYERVKNFKSYAFTLSIKL